MTKKTVRSHRLIDLGAATTVTKGGGNSLTNDGVSGQKIYVPSLTAE